MGSWWQDFRYAWRTLGSQKAFATVVVLSLVLGIGANSAIFSLVDAVLLRRLPVRHPEELVLLGWHSGPQAPAELVSGDTEYDATGISSTSFSYRIYERLRRGSHALTDVFAFGQIDRLNVGAGRQNAVANGQLVSGNYFAALGVRAAAGRLLDAADDRPDAAPVAIISYGLWRRLYGLDPGIMGTAMSLDGRPFTVVGVTPQGFHGALDLGDGPDVTAPLSQAPALAAGPLAETSLLGSDVAGVAAGAGVAGGAGGSGSAGGAGGAVSHGRPETWWLVVMGRLRPGISRAAARAELDVSFAQGQIETGGSAAARGTARLRVLPGDRGLTGKSSDLAEPLLVMMGLVGLVLLAACVNVASLLSSRATARRREIAMRLALGASRGRVVRQLLAESVLLAAIGGTVGLLLTGWSAELLAELLPARPMAMDGGDLLDLVGLFGSAAGIRVLVFTAVVSLACGLLFGLVPALRATRLSPMAALKGRGRPASEGHFRTGQLLVVAQVALALALLIGAGLFVRTLRNLDRIDLGFRPGGILVGRIDPTLDGYHGARLAAFYERLRQRLAQLPEVSAASLSAYTLLGNSATYADFAIAGDRPAGSAPPGGPAAVDLPAAGKGGPAARPAAGEKRPKMVPEQRVDAGFFATMGIPILLGRGFSPGDDEHAPRVAVIAESLARLCFPGQNPIGRRIGRRQDHADREIVGVAADALYSRLRDEMPPTVYLPYRQEPLGAMSLEVRARRGDPAALIPAVRNAVREIDPDLPLFDVKTQVQKLDEAMRQERLLAALASCFGALCLVLAVIGLYGMISFAVSRRIRDMGIRIALGARPGELVWRELRGALLPLIAGLGLGLFLSFAAGRLVAGLLFGLTATDPATTAGAVLVLLAAGALAAFLPARHAALVDPVEALRED
jgi:ABC-type antimicrobial peptide transport system permease subunit